MFDPPAENCVRLFIGLCFVKPSEAPHGFDSTLFGFSQFIAALALLVIVYTVSDVRYKFRLAITPLRLYSVTYWLLAAIGVLTLLTDIWLREGWLVPQTTFLSQAIWEGILALLFFMLAMTWIYYAFIRPPIYGRSNFYNYARALYLRVLKGSDDELPIIADELARSAGALVRFSAQDPPRWAQQERKDETKQRLKPTVESGAHDVLLMIGNRKLCRHIVASSPGSVIAVFNAAALSEKPGLPLGPFARNISTEAIQNKDSILYHEDEGYRSGYFGYVKPFSEAVYGNYALVEALGDRFGSPLDIRYDIVWAWDAAQLSAYTRAVVITLRSYLRQVGDLFKHSYALYRALGIVEDACRDLYKLDGVAEDYYSTDISRRFSAAVQFAVDAIDAIDKQKGLDLGPLRIRGERTERGFCSYLANFMAKLILLAASVKSPADTCWTIHYNIVWHEFFGLGHQSSTWKVIRFKLRRLIYDEICQLNRLPNFQSSRYLGLCLNVMGFSQTKRGGIDAGYRPLKKAVLYWAKRNYLRLCEMQPDVARSCLMGSITYDEANRRLVKTYIKGLDLEAPREYLDLDPPKSGPSPEPGQKVAP